MLNWILNKMTETEPDKTEQLLEQASKDLLSDDPERQASGRRVRGNLGRVDAASQPKPKPKP